MPATAADLQAVLALNESALPHVSSVTPDALRGLVDQSCYVGVARINREIAGFLLALAPGQDYQSLNYRWFAQHYASFVYIDRIVVADRYHGTGIGKMLYQDVERCAPPDSKWLTCEVNLVPPNPGSLVFHRKLGFAEVGQQDTEGGRKRVSLLAKPLTP